MCGMCVWVCVSSGVTAAARSVISLCVYGCLLSQGLAGPRLWLWHAAGQRSRRSRAHRLTWTLWCKRYTPCIPPHTHHHTHHHTHPHHRHGHLSEGPLTLTCDPSTPSSVSSVPLCSHSIAPFIIIWGVSLSLHSTALFTSFICCLSSSCSTSSSLGEVWGAAVLWLIHFRSTLVCMTRM